MISYGPDSYSYFGPDNAIIIGVRFDEYYMRDGQTIQEWDFENRNRDTEADTLVMLMQMNFNKQKNLKIKAIRYNDFSIDRIFTKQKGK